MNASFRRLLLILTIGGGIELTSHRQTERNGGHYILGCQFTKLLTLIAAAIPVGIRDGRFSIPRNEFRVDAPLFDPEVCIAIYSRNDIRKRRWRWI
jgi:hypothetical protein